MPISFCRSLSSCRICAWTVTSSAVVGSSAIRTSGLSASAMAIITRWRMPPESSCGYWVRRRSASGMRTASSASTARRRPSSRPTGSCARIASINCRPMVSTGLSEVIGSWKIIAIRLPRMRRMRPSPSAARSRSPSRTEPCEIFAAGFGRRPMIASDVIDLPEPDSPASASVSPRLSVNDRSETTGRGPSSPPTTTVRCSTARTGASAGAEAPAAMSGRGTFIRRRCAESRTRRPSSACRRSR